MAKASLATAPEDRDGADDVNEDAETELDSNEPLLLTVELLSATELVPEDRLARVCERAEQTGSLEVALYEEGVATSEGIARMRALRYQMAHVDLTALIRTVDGEEVPGVDPEVVKLFPLHVLKRVVAIPYAQDEDGRIYVAVADPQDLYGIDELRFATRPPLELAVASGDDVVAALRQFETVKGLTDSKFDGVTDATLRDWSERATRNLALVNAELAERAAASQRDDQ
jgi:type IV pilus assembly protein PilB